MTTTQVQVQVERRASIATATSSNSHRSLAPLAGDFPTVPHRKWARSTSSHPAEQELVDTVCRDPGVFDHQFVVGLTFGGFGITIPT